MNTRAGKRATEGTPVHTNTTPKRTTAAQAMAVALAAALYAGGATATEGTKDTAMMKMEMAGEMETHDEMMAEMEMAMAEMEGAQGREAKDAASMRMMRTMTHAMGQMHGDLEMMMGNMTSGAGGAMHRETREMMGSMGAMMGQMRGMMEMMGSAGQ